MTTAPYPADTRAKGWRFELDYEKIDQSDTWGLAAEVPMAQAALLMLWLVSWRQEPCGSLPNDENIIRAKCKVPPAVWAKCRGLLMRGWWLAEDGRLYHDTITKRVVEMMEYRRKEAERRAGNRAKNKDSGGSPAGQPSDSPDGVPRDTSGVPDTGTGTGTTTEPNGSGKAPRKRAAPPVTVPAETLIEAGFDESTAAEFIAHKAKAKAPLTARAWADHLSEATKAGWTPMQAAEKVMAKGWKGFEAKYVAREPPRGLNGNGHYGKPDPSSTVANNPQIAATQRLLREQAEHAAKATPPPASVLALRSRKREHV